MNSSSTAHQNLQGQLSPALSERVISTSAEVPLVAGLLWRAVNQARHSLKHLHQVRDLNTDASHYVMCQSEGALVYGLYQPGSLEDGVALPKNVHSAAHCFANLVGKDSPNAALILNLKSGTNQHQSKVYVVVLEYGVPAVDLLSSELEAHNALGSEERTLWSDSPYTYPNANVADFDWLATGISKTSRIAKIPMNPWPWVTGAVVVAAAAGIYGLMHQHKKTQALQELAAVQVAQDPVPKYLQALQAQAPTMASKRADIEAMARHLFEARIVVPGWVLRSVNCSAVQEQCLTRWERKGGTFEDLRAALPAQKLVSVQTVQSEAEQRQEASPLDKGTSVPALEVATTQERVSVGRTNWLQGSPGGGPQVVLAPFGKQVFEASVQWQEWATAGLSVHLKEPPQLWPQAADVPSEFTHPQALQASSFKVSGVAGPLVLEVIQSAPAWVSWEHIHARVGDGELASRLLFDLTGTYYAKAQP
jgi:hypothetical protein